MQRIGRKVVALAVVAGSMLGLAGDKHETTPSAGASVGAVVDYPGSLPSAGDVVKVNDHLSDAERVGAAVDDVSKNSTETSQDSVGHNVGASVGPAPVEKAVADALSVSVRAGANLPSK